MTRLRIGLAQLHHIPGDIAGNVDKINSYSQKAAAQGCDVAVFGELAVSGYLHQDLILRSDFIADCDSALQEIVQGSSDLVSIVGHPTLLNEEIFNSASALQSQNILHTAHKERLPNTSVFDEQRYFTPGINSEVFRIGDVSAGIVICHDIWFDDSPALELANAGAEILFVVNASPFRIGKQQDRNAICTRVVEQTGIPLVYVNIVGGHDGLVFDGGSTVYGANAKPITTVTNFQHGLAVFDIDLSQPCLPLKTHSEPEEQWLEDVWQASCVGLRDYVHDNGFDEVGIGLSGGIDSAMTVAIAAEALGAENVHAVSLPSQYSSDHSLGDSEQLCANLGVNYSVLPIKEIHSAFADSLGKYFGTEVTGLVDENLQARIRGVSLLALANKHNWLIVATGNKSELAVGYSTLYGDTVGAYGAIRDLWKTQLYQLANWYNTRRSNALPQNIISKAPSAELRPDQTDAQSLPVYEVLDEILRLHIDEHLGVKEIADAGFDLETVSDILRKVDIAEYKRRQSAIGTRVSAKSFGADRRVPITQRYRQD